MLYLSAWKTGCWNHVWNLARLVALTNFSEIRGHNLTSSLNMNKPKIKYFLYHMQENAYWAMYELIHYLHHSNQIAYLPVKYSQSLLVQEQRSKQHCWFLSLITESWKAIAKSDQSCQIKKQFRMGIQKRLLETVFYTAAWIVLVIPVPPQLKDLVTALPQPRDWKTFLCITLCRILLCFDMLVYVIYSTRIM